MYGEKALDARELGKEQIMKNLCAELWGAIEDYLNRLCAKISILYKYGEWVGGRHCRGYFGNSQKK